MTCKRGDGMDVPVGTPGAYTGVQYVDLERSDPNLVGFSGGFSVRSSEPTVEKPLDSPEKRSESGGSSATTSPWPTARRRRRPPRGSRTSRARSSSRTEATR